MKGSDGVRDALTFLLIEILPRKIEALRAVWQLDTGALPDIGAITSGEMPEEALTDVSNTWVEIVNPRMLAGMKWVDITPAGDPQFHIRYACRLYVWALGEDWDQSLLRRDKLVAAVRSSLLEYPTLTPEGGDTEYLVLTDTWSEEYGVPTRVDNDSGRCWCSAVLSVDARAEETLADGRLREPIGQAGRVILATGVVGPRTEIPDDFQPDQVTEITTGATP